jgi:hypothetical protein
MASLLLNNGKFGEKIRGVDLGSIDCRGIRISQTLLILLPYIGNNEK